METVGPFTLSGPPGGPYLYSGAWGAGWAHSGQADADVHCTSTKAAPADQSVGPITWN